MTTMKGMKAVEAHVESVESYIADDQWSMTQKLDGVRVMVQIDWQGEMAFTGASGDPVVFAAAAQHFPKLREQFKDLRSVVIDGELLIENGDYWAFDLPYAKQAEIRVNTPYRLRIAGLDLLGIQRVPLAVSPEEKRDLWERVISQNAEGAVVRRLGDPYEIGRRSTNLRKLKLVKTADVVVVASSRGRNEAGRETGSFTLAVYDGWKEDSEGTNRRLLRTVGACSAIGKPHVEIGDVIEVAFLYATKDLVLYQPRMMRKREDKIEVECDLDQIKQFVTNREVIRT